MATTKYTVLKREEKFHAARIKDGDETALGARPKYKQAQLLCEQSAGQKLDWYSLGGGNYEATR